MISFLRSLFSREGYPPEIVSDHGSLFMSVEFKTFLKERGIHQLHSSVYHPQANGMAEQFNRVLKDYVQLASLEKRPLQEAVTECLGMYRATPHASTGITTTFLLHERNFRIGLDLGGSC